MLHKAIEFATIAHKNQVRKGTGVPYIVHPFEVCQILTAAGAEEWVICAGILHDTVEDTAITLEDIKNEFTDQIAALVSANSENKTLSWEKRKQHTIDYLKNRASFEEMLVACADKLSNLRSLQFDRKKMGESIWSRFNRGYEKQKWYYKELLDALKPLNDYAMYQELAAAYQDIFQAV
ncbi:hypothetical protein SDC9_126770 [bioreactor metagenome]|uniref:HD domain-containing protein n=1 Tax=bioreactor metagenome TaxID=1076179 RepID=A0A645CRK6_9ZZZZ